MLEPDTQGAEPAAPAIGDPRVYGLSLGDVGLVDRQHLVSVEGVRRPQHEAIRQFLGT